MEPNQTPDPSPRNRLSSGIVAAGAAFAMTLAGLGVAAAQTDDEAPSSSTTEAPATAPAEEAKPERPARRTETELTGEAAEKVKAAALAAVPGGEITRVETDDDGAPYEAHVKKADGTFVTVKLDESFNVTSVEDDGRASVAGRNMRGPGGRHHKGAGGGSRSGETLLTGEQAEKATAAAQAAVPGGTVERVETDAHGAAFEAHVEKADGTHVTVKMDENFSVTGVEEHTKPS